MDNWRKRVSTDPTICHGEPCITGTRIMVSVILGNPVDGLTPDEIVTDYALLTVMNSRAAMMLRNG